jgi:hypothetical protein
MMMQWLTMYFRAWQLTVKSFWLLAVVLVSLSWHSPLYAAITLTAASGGSVPSNTTAGCSAAGTWTTLTNPKMVESNAGEIGVGTIIINAPVGFEFNTSSAVTVTLSGGNATISRNINGVANNTVFSTTLTTSSISFTVTSASNSSTKNTLTWQGIQVRPTASSPQVTGNLTKSGTSTISGVTNGTTNLGTLTETASIPVCNPTAPTVTTNAATSLSVTGATLNGTVSSNGAATTVTFDYGLTTAYGSSATATQSPLAASANAAIVSKAITGLTCSTTYHFRVKGVNTAGTSNGSDLTFTTSTCTAPTVTTTSPATAITTNSATLNGTVTSNSSSTTASFSYGTTTSYGSSITASQSPLSGAVSAATISGVVTGLSCNTLYHFLATATNGGGTGNGSDVTFTTLTCPSVTSINTASPNPTAANTVVSWTVIFSASVTGVNTSDFSLVQAGGTTGATINSVTGSGTTYTVTANTGTGTVGTLKLNLIDDDSIINAAATPLGGSGAGNGNFGGQTYTLIVPVCNSSMLFCDDFERSVATGGLNTASGVGVAAGYGAWTVSWATQSNCNGTTGTNAGCAGIDSDVAPWSTASNPRANTTRAMFTRWSNVSVTSPVINLSALPASNQAAQLSLWLRRGSDCFSEWPGDNQAGCNIASGTKTAVTGEEFRVEYKNNVGAWTTLAQYPTEATPGEILIPVIDLPDDALHAAFQLRFTQPGGSGSGINNAGAAGVIGTDYWHVDNVTLISKPAVAYAGGFCDTFEGDLSRWTMTGVGDVRIGSTFFQNGAHNLDFRWNNVFATTKTTDLTSVTGDITFWVKRGTGSVSGGSYPNPTGSDYPETGKNLTVEYFNSSNTWTPLTSFAGGGTDGQIYPTSASASAIGTANATRFTLPANAKHSKFKLRFNLLTGSGIYDQDYWHIDDVCVGNIVQTADLSLTKTSSGTFTPGQYVTYTMTVTNAGPNVEPGAISIIDTLPAGLNYQSGSAGWACSAAGQVVTCTRAGSLAVGSSASVTLTATVDSSVSAGTITNTATVGGQSLDTNLANNTATKADTAVVPSYVFTDKLCSVGVPLGTGTQCNYINWSPQIAGQTLSNIYITAVNGLGVPTALNASSATTVNMQFALSCSNPVADAGVAATFSATASALPLCTPNGATPSAWTAATALSFPAAQASVGPYDFNYADVGSVELFMRDFGSPTKIGKSGVFVVKPAGLVLSSIMPSVNRTGRCAVNPNSSPVCASVASDTAEFVKAGEAFTVTVTATTVSGTAAPNFGKEQAPETVKLSSSLVTPVGGANPTITGSFGAFSGGVATGALFKWNEVGILTLTPSISDGDYLGIGDIVGTSSSNIGRFYPDHFTVTGSDGALAAACGGFTYTGQTMNYQTAPYLTIKAMSATDTITTNYTGTFQKLIASGISITTPTADSTQNGKDGLNKTNLTAALSTGTLNNSSGTLTYTLNNADTFSYTRNGNALIAPYSSDIRLAVTAVAEPSLDGVTATGTLPTLKPTAVGIRYGRVMLQNAYGSELLDLALPLTAQYWNGNSWIINSNDSCTDTTLSFTAAGTSDITNRTCVIEPANNSGKGCAVTPVIANYQFLETGLLGIDSNGAAGFAGNFNLWLKAVGLGNTGYLDVTAAVPSYLQFDWTGAGINNPKARATFGIYNGNNNKVIYSRELY